MRPEGTPLQGFKGLAAHWREDLLAAFSVALVALPLALGIAIASGVPPIAGLISSIIGGIVTTLFRGSHVGINGPGNGLIVVTLMALNALDNGGGNTYNYVLAAFVVSGVIQVGFGLLRLGKYGDFFPSSVIHGMLAAIGIIILGKQIHVALGVSSVSSNGFGTLMEIPQSLMKLNPFVTLIGLVSLLLLVLHPKLKSKVLHFIPAPMWVLIISIPLVFAFDFFDNHQIALLGKSYEVGPQFLTSVPDNILDGFMFPDFSMIGTGAFWLVVVSVCLISSLETVVSAKAVEKLDPYKRKTALNRDLVGVGLSTVLAGLIGGLPVITVIIRSSVNVNNGAKTKWSNFFHGLILLAFVMIFPGFIQMVPVAALAAILVFTGYKLVSPRVFRTVYRRGWEQLLIMVVTLIATLLTNLLWGIFAGILFTLTIHYLRAGIPFSKFIRYLVNPFSKVIRERDDSFLLKVKGVSNFFNILHMIKHISTLPSGKRVVVDYSHARLVDFTVLEYMHEFAEDYERGGGTMDLVGLDIHETSSHHPNALHVSKQQKKIIRLTRRQARIKKMAAQNNLPFNPEISYEISSLKNFRFFKTRPIQYKKNMIKGYEPDLKVKWEISDITFDEGVLVVAETHRTTIETLELPFTIPVFSLEKEVFFDKLLELTGIDDIDLKDYKHFSNRFSLRGPDEQAIRTFFTPELIAFFEKMDIYHLESCGNEILVFKYLRLASPSELMKMHHFSRQLVRKLKIQSSPHPDYVEKDE